MREFNRGKFLILLGIGGITFLSGRPDISLVWKEKVREIYPAKDARQLLALEGLSASSGRR